MVKTKKLIRSLSLIFVFIFLILSSVGCGQTASIKDVTLNYWGVWDDPSDFKDIIAAYQAKHPNVTINYKRFRYEEYERLLLEAFAEDRGPDIFSINNTWVQKYKSKITPEPASVQLPYQSTVLHLGGLQKETVIENKESKLLTPRQIKENFLSVVYGDVVSPDPADKGLDKVYGVPLSVDTMVLFYNRDLLNSAGISQPAKTWTEFQEHVKQLVKQDKDGKIIQAGAAIGTGENVSRSFDLLSVLMMQNGTSIQEGNSITMASKIKGRETPPGEQALIFYTDFANPQKEVYTWNSEMSNSLETFINGQTAYFFGYSFSLQDIKNRAPKLNFSYTELPQIGGNSPVVNYANYWVETVAKKSANANWAWDFVNFAASQDQAKKYLTKTKKPTALRSLVEYQSQQEDMLPFVTELLTAKSWFRGQDSAAAEQIFKEMIEVMVKGEATASESVNRAANRLQTAL